MSASEKTTVLARVASSTLPKRQVLKDLGVPKSTYYRWLTREQRCQGLENQPEGGLAPWNRLSQPEEQAVRTVARRAPELSCRQLAAWITDNQGFSVSESTVYRILRREGLVKSPKMQLKAGKEYHRKTTGPNQMWATDASYFKVIGWGYYYLVTVMDDFSRFILAHKLQRDTTSAGITHIKLPGSKQRTILDESHRSISHGCRQPSNQAHKTISRRGELAAPGSGGGFHHVCTPFKLLRARTSPLVASLHL